jgi:hypothetical protein
MRRLTNNLPILSASSPIVSLGRRGAGKAPKLNKCAEDCHVDELIKRKKSVRAPKLLAFFARLSLTSPGKNCDNLSREAGSLLPQPSGLAHVLILKLSRYFKSVLMQEY